MFLTIELSPLMATITPSISVSVYYIHPGTYDLTVLCYRMVFMVSHSLHIRLDLHIGSSNMLIPAGGISADVPASGNIAIFVPNNLADLSAQAVATLAGGAYGLASNYGTYHISTYSPQDTPVGWLLR